MSAFIIQINVYTIKLILIYYQSMFKFSVHIFMINILCEFPFIIYPEKNIDKNFLGKCQILLHKRKYHMFLHQ